MLRFVSGLAAVLAIAVPTYVAAAGDPPAPADAIFNTRHLDLVGKGKGLKYKFEHIVSDEKLLGKAFTDDIVVDVNDEGESGQRDLDVTVFTGDRQRPIQNYEDLTINPVFVWFLDKCVENYRLLSGGNQPYLKGRFRDAFIDKAKIEPVKLDFAGKSVEGYTITMVPFEGDPNVHKMSGFEKSKFTITLSKDVPGYFYSMGSEIFSSQAGTGKLQDRLTLVEAK